jgi:hypothetical protein
MFCAGLLSMVPISYALSGIQRSLQPEAACRMNAKYTATNMDRLAGARPALCHHSLQAGVPLREGEPEGVFARWPHAIGTKMHDQAGVANHFG